MKMDPENIAKLDNDEVFIILSDMVPTMMCEVPVVGTIAQVGIHPDGQAHLHVFDPANDKECCMSVPQELARAAMGVEVDDDVQEEACTYIARILAADFN